MPRRGFTVVELVIAITVLGISLGFGLPLLRQAMIREQVRSARREVTSILARARGIAVQRGCPATVTFDAALDRVWVTSCTAVGAGVETVGSVAELDARYGIQLASSAGSVTYGPHGLGMAAGWTGVQFTKNSYTDTLAISPVGRAVW